MRKAIMTIIIFLLLIGSGVIAGQNELKRVDAEASASYRQVTEPLTETESETQTAEKAATVQVKTTETTTENYPETYSEKPNGMIFYNEQGNHTKSLGRFYITGYTAEEGFPEGSATASGVGCRPGICAMNDRQRKELGIKYGDSIYIDGLGTYQVQDCGCAYGVVDVWCYTNAEAYSMTGYYEVYKK